MSIDNIQVSFGAETSQWSKGLKDAGKDLDGLQNKTKSFFKDTKSMFGKGSLLGQSLKLAAGGGAIAGITLATREATEFANKLGGIRKMMADGMGAKDIATDLARSLPVLGGMVQMFDAFRNAITGEQDQIDAQNKLVDEQNAAWKKRVQYIKEGADAQKHFTELIRKASEERQIEETPEGDQREKLKVHIETNDKLHSLKADFDKDAKTDVIKDLQKQLKDLAGKNDDESLRKVQNVQMQLQPLLDNYNKLYKDYWAARNEITQLGADKEKDIDKKTFDAAQKVAAEQQKKWDEYTEKNRDHLKKLGESVTQNVETPMQHYLQEMQKLDLLLATKSIDANTFKLFGAKLLQSYDQESQPQQESYKATEVHEMRFSGTVPGMPSLENPLNKLNATATKQLEEQRRTNKLTEDTINKVQKGEITLTF